MAMSEEEWLEAFIPDCQCCGVCWQLPCEGCISGRSCDAMPCYCDVEEEDIDNKEDIDREFGIDSSEE